MVWHLSVFWKLINSTNKENTRKKKNRKKIVMKSAFAHQANAQFTAMWAFFIVLIGSAVAIPRQESFGNTNINVNETPLPTSVQMTGYQAWPSGFVKGTYAFFGSSNDGQSMWLVPYNADRVVAQIGRAHV